MLTVLCIILLAILVNNIRYAHALMTWKGEEESNLSGEEEAEDAEERKTKEENQKNPSVY